MNSNALHVTVSILIFSYCENIIKIESNLQSVKILLLPSKFEKKLSPFENGDSSILR